MADFDQAEYRLMIDPDTDQPLNCGMIRLSKSDDWWVIFPGPLDGHLGARFTEPKISELVYQKNRPFPFSDGTQNMSVHFYGNRYL